MKSLLESRLYCFRHLRLKKYTLAISFVGGQSRGVNKNVSTSQLFQYREIVNENLHQELFLNCDLLLKER